MVCSPNARAHAAGVSATRRRGVEPFSGPRNAAFVPQLFCWILPLPNLQAEERGYVCADRWLVPSGRKLFPRPRHLVQVDARLYTGTAMQLLQA